MSPRASPSRASLLGPGSELLRPELADLKIIAVEEHFAFPDLLGGLSHVSDAAHDASDVVANFMALDEFNYAKSRFVDIGKRIQDMDEEEIAVQIISLAGAVNTTFLDPEPGAALARKINARLKQAADNLPSRLIPLAELPFQSPHQAIEELRRCVSDGFVGAMLSGSVGGNGRFLDDSHFDPILSAFEELDVPLFLHPGIPPKAVMDTYFTMPQAPTTSAILATFGWGWHNEVAIHILRLAISGTFERHRKLKVVIGHQGEMLPPMLQRFDQAFDYRKLGLQRTIGETLREQVWLCISGIFSIPATLNAVQTWGVDRILFGNDYPFVQAQGVGAFVRTLGEVIAPSDLRKICQTNAENLFKIADRI